MRASLKNTLGTVDAVLTAELASFYSMGNPNDIMQFILEGLTRDTLQIIATDAESVLVSPKHRLFLFAQAVIKFIYSSSYVKQRLRQDRSFSIWIVDSLHFLIHCWKANASREVDRDPELLDYFYRLLFGKRTRASRQAEEKLLTGADEEFLRDLVRTQMWYFAKPWEFFADWLAHLNERSIDRSEYNDHFLENLIGFLIVPDQIPLLEKPTRTTKGTLSNTTLAYQWIFDYAGNPRGRTRSEKEWRYYRAIRAGDWKDLPKITHGHACQYIDILEKITEKKQGKLAEYAAAALLPRSAWRRVGEFLEDETTRELLGTNGNNGGVGPEILRGSIEIAMINAALRCARIRAGSDAEILSLPRQKFLGQALLGDGEKEDQFPDREKLVANIVDKFEVPSEAREEAFRHLRKVFSIGSIDDNLQYLVSLSGWLDGVRKKPTESATTQAADVELS